MGRVEDLAAEWLSQEPAALEHAAGGKDHGPFSGAHSRAQQG